MSYSAGYKIDIVLSDVELIKVLSWDPPAGSADTIERAFRDSLILQLFASTGIRLNELCMLNKSSIQAFGERAWLLIEGKGSRPRRVPLSNRLVARILLYLEFRRNQQSPCLLSPTRGSVGNRLGKLAIYRSCRARSMDLLGWVVNPHRFRHSIATYWIRHGVNIRTVQTLLGHTDLGSTTRYLHTSADDLVQAVDLLYESARIFEPGLFSESRIKSSQSGR